MLRKWTHSVNILFEIIGLFLFTYSPFSSLYYVLYFSSSYLGALHFIYPIFVRVMFVCSLYDLF